MHPILVAVSPIATVFVTHFVSSNLYNQLCAPLSFQGFITSIISTASPVCSNILTVMNLSSQAYSLAIVSGFTLLINSLGMKVMEAPKQA